MFAAFFYFTCFVLTFSIFRMFCDRQHPLKAACVFFFFMRECVVCGCHTHSFRELCVGDESSYKSHTHARTRCGGVPLNLDFCRRFETLSELRATAVVTFVAFRLSATATASSKATEPLTF